MGSVFGCLFMHENLGGHRHLIPGDKEAASEEQVAPGTPNQ